MAWNPYGLDQIAHRLVQRALQIDDDPAIAGDSCLREVYEMRESVAYGLERFWGEQLRHDNKGQKKNATYWKETWATLVEILHQAGVVLPNDGDANTMAKKLWGETPLNPTGVKLSHENRQLTLAVLTQLCNCMVWWTQRHKPKKP